MERRVIIALVGMAGVGKDTIASIMRERRGYNVICSYTTRPMRQGEVNGREHWFVETCDDTNKLAYTQYGGYEYWTTYSQLDNKKPNVYVIDEDGVKVLKSNNIGASLGYDIAPVYIKASDEVKKKRGVSEERMARDKTRQLLPIEFYDHVITNDGTEEELISNIDKVCNIIEQTYKY